MTFEDKLARLEEIEKEFKGYTWERLLDVVFKLREELAEKTGALKDLFALMDEGWLVRDISNDASPTFGSDQLPFIMRLKKAQEAVAKWDRSKEGE